MAKDKVQESGSVISTAPHPAPLRSDSQSAISVDVIRDEASAKSLYWAGTLLMEGDFDMDHPAALHSIEDGIISEDNSGEYRTTIRTSAWKLWFPNNGAARFWACRNRYYQQLDATGITFPAFSQENEGDATNEALTHLRTYPGHVFPMSDTELKDALEAVKNTVLRPRGPAWRSHPGASIVNYMHGHLPGCKGGRLLTAPFCAVCKEIERGLPTTSTAERPVRNTTPEYRTPADLPISDYVYLMKLDAPWDTPKNEYVHLVKSLPDFIKNQPPPLSRDLSKAASEKAA